MTAALGDCLSCGEPVESGSEAWDSYEIHGLYHEDCADAENRAWEQMEHADGYPEDEDS